MRVKLPKYVHGFTDRHGKSRYYFRRAGYESLVLPGIPWSPEFMAVHEAAMKGEVLPRHEVGADRTMPGTINALCVAYFSSGDFKLLSENTQTTYRGILERFREEHGTKRVVMLQREHVQRMMSGKSGTPAAAHNLLRMIRLIMKFSVIHGWRRDDPTVGLKSPKMRQGGFHTWSEEEIAKFEATHAVGSRARKAFGLLLYTAQRRSDVIRMGRQHIREGAIVIRQQKTGTLVEIPMHPDLRTILDATPSDHLTFLTTAAGSQFTAAGFGNWFKDVCREAGLPSNCAAHGLRKAASRRLAEAGCTAHQIMSITGHKTLREVTRYTEAADRRALAVSAIEKLGRRTSSVKP